MPGPWGVARAAWPFSHLHLGVGSGVSQTGLQSLSHTLGVDQLGGLGDAGCLSPTPLSLVWKFDSSRFGEGEAEVQCSIHPGRAVSEQLAGTLRLPILLLETLPCSLPHLNPRGPDHAGPGEGTKGRGQFRLGSLVPPLFQTPSVAPVSGTVGAGELGACSPLG